MTDSGLITSKIFKSHRLGTVVLYKILELTADRLQSNYNYQNRTDLDVNIDRYHQINKQTEFLGCLDVNIVMIPLIEQDFKMQTGYNIIIKFTQNRTGNKFRDFVNNVMIPLIEQDFQNADRLQQNYQIHTDLFC